MTFGKNITPPPVWGFEGEDQKEVAGVLCLLEGWVSAGETGVITHRLECNGGL